MLARYEAYIDSWVPPGFLRALEALEEVFRTPFKPGVGDAVRDLKQFMPARISEELVARGVSPRLLVGPAAMEAPAGYIPMGDAGLLAVPKGLPGDLLTHRGMQSEVVRTMALACARPIMTAIRNRSGVDAAVLQSWAQWSQLEWGAGNDARSLFLLGVSNSMRDQGAEVTDETSEAMKQLTMT